VQEATREPGSNYRELGRSQEATRGHFCYQMPSTVRNTIVKHFSPQISINVKRKFKLGSGNKIIKWWHVVSGDEETMALLETEWDKINAQTSWNIKTLPIICRPLRGSWRKQPDA